MIKKLRELWAKRMRLDWNFAGLLIAVILLGSALWSFGYTVGKRVGGDEMIEYVGQYFGHKIEVMKEADARRAEVKKKVSKVKGLRIVDDSSSQYAPTTEGEKYIILDSKSDCGGEGEDCNDYKESERGLETVQPERETAREDNPE